MLLRNHSSYATTGHFDVHNEGETGVGMMVCGHEAVLEVFKGPLDALVIRSMCVMFINRQLNRQSKIASKICSGNKQAGREEVKAV